MSEHKRNPTALQFKPAGGGAAPSRVRDASGKILELGDEILVVMPSCLMRVASIKPILHPGAPPNLMELVLVTRLQMAVPRDQGVENLYMLRHQADIGDGAIETSSPDGEPPVGDESGPAEKATSIELTDSER
jgi:hypothetical protein